MNRKLFILFLITFPISLFAADSPDFSAFKYYKNVTPSISIPSVIEVPFKKESFSIPVFAVFNLTTSVFEPYLLSVKNLETQSRIESVGAMGSTSFLNDENYGTYAEFPLNGDRGEAKMTFFFDKPITASSLFFTLDSYVALPQSISISAEVSGRNYVVLAPVRPSGGNIVFPKTTSSIWHVVFDYVQPLRVSEIKFNDMSSGQTADRGLRFLAQPGQSYQVYFDADRYVTISTKEAGDLFRSDDIFYSKATASILNPEYRPADSDSDGVPDLSDNCISIPNVDQKDLNSNGLGDACEDYDRDRVLNANDNCPEIPNSGQTDTDKDKIGDTCDSFDNRVTERMPWLPWVGIGLAGAVILGLFVIVFRHKKESDKIFPTQ